MARPRSISDEKILDAARACFLEHGGRAATTLIAERLGISHALLFQRFGTKEKLMRAALLPRSEPAWMGDMRTGPQGSDARERLCGHAAQILEFYQSLIPSLAVLRAAGIVPDFYGKKTSEIPPVKARREVIEWFSRARQKRLIGPIDPAHAADLLLGALFFRPFQQHVGQVAYTPAEDRAFVEFAVGAVWNAAKPARKRGRS